MLFGIAVVVLTMVVLLMVSGLLARFMMTPSAEAWEGPMYRVWLTLGVGCLLAVAVFLPVYPIFRPFGTGPWLSWVFPCCVVLPGVALVVLASRPRPGRREPNNTKPVLYRPASVVVAAIWVVLICWFYTWGAGRQLLVAGVGLAVLGLTATTISLGQNKRLQVEARTADGQVDAAATDYLLCRLRSLGSRPPEALSFAQATDLSQLVSQDLSAIPNGALAAAIARVMYAIRPGLAWRARIIQVDAERLTVQLSRNSKQVQNTVISRPDLKLPAIPAGATGADLTEKQDRAKAQLLTGAAACVLVQLSRVHRQLRPGLCGATEWKSVALHVIATEPALAETPDVNIALLRESTNADRHYALGRLDYLMEHYKQTTPKTPAVRRRFAKLLYAQLRYTRTAPDKDPEPGYEVMYLRILYTTTAIRFNCCIVALIEYDLDRERLLRRRRPELAEVQAQAKTLVAQCERLRQARDCRDEHVCRYADNLYPMAENLLDAVRCLTEGRNTGGYADECQTPDIAVHNAARAGLMAAFASPWDGRFGNVIDQLTFAVAGLADYVEVLGDPSFWLPKLRSEIVSGVSGFRPDMLGLAAFSPYAGALRKAGITTFRQFQARTADAKRQRALATYLSTDPVVVAHLAELAKLATSCAQLTDADVLAVFIGAGITSNAELHRRKSNGTAGLIKTLRATAQQQGRASLEAIRTLDIWLSRGR